VQDEFRAAADSEVGHVRTLGDNVADDRQGQGGNSESGRRPRVAVIGTRGYPSGYGGFETAGRKLAPFLWERGWDVTVYSREPTGADPTGPVRVVRTLGRDTRRASALTFGLTSTLHAAVDRPDVALVMNVANGFFLPLLRIRGIATLMNVDGIEWERKKWGRLAKRVFHRGASYSARWADQLVFDSEAIGDRWRTDFERSGVFIPYGGDVPSSDLPLESGLSHRGYILYVARFVPENSVDEFFDAVETLALRWPVVIVGSSGYGGPIDLRAASLARRHASVRWLGQVRDDARLLSLWQHAGLYFHGHSVGGTNPALVQAMAAGAPVLARDTPYNREVVGLAGEFCGASASSIVEAASRLMTSRSEGERLSTMSRERVETSYRWEMVCSRYEQALRSLLGSPVGQGH
jgi:glycosyltransferase involved in cell wall biosynthesis